MAIGQIDAVRRQLHKAVLRDGCGPTDGQLLESFVQYRDETAFEALVHRHGPLVLGVCERVMGRADDAEDAFQATFLVLVRRAASIVPRELVGNWLYGVAFRTALAARGKNNRRRAKEKQLDELPHAATEPRSVWHDLQPLLDQELNRLTDKFRMPVVLCDLQGRSRAEAARQLNLPEGTLSSRLAAARKLLSQRLTRRGVMLSGAALATLLAQNVDAASVPLLSIDPAVKAASLIAMGQSTAGVISAKVMALTEGVIQAMFLTKLKFAAVALLTVAILGGVTGLLAQRALADKRIATTAIADDKKEALKEDGRAEISEVSGVVQTVDAAQNKIALHPTKQHPQAQNFDLARDAKVYLDDGTGDKLGFLDGKLTDLAAGDSVTLRIQGTRVFRIWVDGPTVQGTLKEVDVAKRIITVAVAMSKIEPVADKTFAVARGAKLSIEDFALKDKSKPSKETTLADLPANAMVALKLSADRKVVGNIRAEGQVFKGFLKSVDAAKSTVTVTISFDKGDPGADKVFTVDKNAQVSVDDGVIRDKTKPIKAQSLNDLPVGALVVMRQSLDQQSVVAIRAEGTSTHGAVKALDADKGTITLHDKLEGEKTYTVMKDAAVYIDDKGEKKFADVPVESFVNLSLLADQKTVREIRVHGPTVAGALAGNAANDIVSISSKEGTTSYNVAKDARISLDDKKPGKLADLIDGTVVQARLSADKSLVLDIQAAGPSFRGLVKGIDPDKNKIVLLIGSKNGEGGEEKEFKLTKDTIVGTEAFGVPVKLTDLKDKDVVLRLSQDQKSTYRITVVGE